MAKYKYHIPFMAVMDVTVYVELLEVITNRYIYVSSSCLWFSVSCYAVNCGQPDVDMNGFVYGNDWWVDSVVRYVCRPGFMLIGDPARACQSNGRWTAKPSCLSKPHIYKLHI